MAMRRIDELFDFGLPQATGRGQGEHRYPGDHSKLQGRDDRCAGGGSPQRPGAGLPGEAGDLGKEREFRIVAGAKR
eukprot:scaffold647897_cov39-Prasinocladus_malaysianus.AAC.3